jgi:hypothetical protein
MDLSANIGFLPVAGLTTKPLPVSETLIVVMGILSVVAVN